MSKLLMVATLSAAVLAGTAHAEVNCTEVRPNKKFDTFEFSGAVLKDTKGKLYRTYSTDADTDIRTRCSGDWANPIDHWLYGDDNWLWSDSNKRYDQKGALQAAKTVSQTKPSRFVCEDSAENDAKVGWFSYSYSGKGEMKLEFLCTDPDFRKKGYGLTMINKAIAKGAEHFTQVERFTMKLVSHPKAVDFYNGLLMDCQHDYIQEQSVFTFTASISTQNLRPVAKKLQCYKPAELGLSNGFQRISYAGSCLNNDEYESFVELNVKTRDTGIIEDDVLTQTCNADGYLPEGTIPYKTVKDGIQKWLEEQR